MRKARVAILGSGNIGTDLMIKVQRLSTILEVVAVAGIDPESAGLALATSVGIMTTHAGIDGLIGLPQWDAVDIVLDATSAGAHARHDAICRGSSKRLIDLTPAAIGPYCVPVVNMNERLEEPSINMVTCGGQATIPVVHAVRRVSESLPYAEIVASMSSRSAGPGTRANIDEATRTTARAIETVGGAQRGKAIIILNPAEPPMLMRNTVFVLSVGGSKSAITRSVSDMVAEVQQYVPGYRIKHDVQFRHHSGNNKARITGVGEFEGLQCIVFLEVEGAGHFLPAYAGNLDIMTSAALRAAEQIAEHGVKIAA